MAVVLSRSRRRITSAFCVTATGRSVVGTSSTVARTTPLAISAVVTCRVVIATYAYCQTRRGRSASFDPSLTGDRVCSL